MSKVPVKQIEYLFFDECFCNDVEFQTYENTISMKAPFPLPNREDGWVGIDTCIATEIGWLWKNDIKTINSCCGHGKKHSWVIVNKESEPFMDKHYESYKAPSGMNCYLLKTGYAITLKELDFMRTAQLNNPIVKDTTND